MTSPSLIYFDIAAVVVMLITILSLVMRRMTRGATNRVYLVSMALVTLTALVNIFAETHDLLCFSQTGTISAGASPFRDTLSLIYYALRSLTAPMYLVLIATISGTTHRLDRNLLVRVALWVPMVGIVVFVLSNPIHNLVFVSVNGIPARGPFFWTLYVIATYYALIGIVWLIRWKSIINRVEFSVMMALYPLIYVSLIIQYAFPVLNMEMFITSISMMLLSAFVIRPETQMDSVVNAASLQGYREMCNRAFATGKKMILVYLEVINLDRIRDFVGKDELQDILCNVSNNLSKSLNRDDVLYYLRNGLFCIAPRSTDVDRAVKIAQKSHSEGRERALANHNQRMQAKMRTCIVRIPEDASDNDTLKTFMKRFSYLVPDSCVTTFSLLSMREEFELEMALTDIVESAIDNRSFEVHYQPILSTHDNRFHSAEALIRLDDPKFGWIPPTLFVPEAEQNGLITEIGTILIEKVCAFLRTVDYEATGLDYIEINLSTDQCIRPGFAHELLAIMDRNRVESSRLNLEITETSSSYSQEIINENVRLLAGAGLAFSIDDYGTGYSNLARTMSLPFSIIKIDKSIADGYNDPKGRIILEDTISMMKKIDKKVLVEGIETTEQADELIKMGIDYIQGFCYAKPMPEDEFIAFLKEQNASSLQ